MINMTTAIFPTWTQTLPAFPLWHVIMASSSWDLSYKKTWEHLLWSFMCAKKHIQYYTILVNLAWLSGNQLPDRCSLVDSTSGHPSVLVHDMPTEYNFIKVKFLYPQHNTSSAVHGQRKLSATSRSSAQRHSSLAILMSFKRHPYFWKSSGRNISVSSTVSLSLTRPKKVSYTGP